MKFLIIAPTHGTRHPPLVAQLATLGYHETHLVDAVMLQALPPGFDSQRSNALTARTLTPGEVGCATSHRRAWHQFLASTDDWACVMEDDARVNDCDALAAILYEVSGRPSLRAEVISLFANGAVLSQRPDALQARCRFEPPFTVAYLINRAGAESLAEANQDATQLADWPRASGVTFHLALGHIIGHGDETTGSVIGSERFAPECSTRVGFLLPTTTKVLHRLALYSFIHYLRNRRHFASPLHYYRIVLRHRVLWHLGRFAGRCIDAERNVFVLTWRCNRLVDFARRHRCTTLQ
jgi:hypothetical protein